MLCVDQRTVKCFKDVNVKCIGETSEGSQAKTNALSATDSCCTRNISTISTRNSELAALDSTRNILKRSLTPVMIFAKLWMSLTSIAQIL